MDKIDLDISYVNSNIAEEKIKELCNGWQELLSQVLESYKKDMGQELGWMNLETLANEKLLDNIEAKAKEIKAKADVFVLIGVGGSNQGARAALKAMQQKGTPEIIYTGNNLSPRYMTDVLEKIKGKSVYVNVIAKNFSTLEPGICFRMIRKCIEEAYGKEEAAKRIICTGTIGSSLEELANQEGYGFLPFPEDVGGRFSVLSAVGLLPIAVGGISLQDLLDGAKDMRNYIKDTPAVENDALKYAVVRNLLLEQGKYIELMAHFEPSLEFFAKWWIQLFGESEGKDDKGIFPSSVNFSEDLHAMGQYIQDGKKILFETFINVQDEGCSLVVPRDEAGDGFDYLEQKDFAWINKMAYQATLKAHSEGGIPCMVFNVPKLNAYYMGQLFYLFQMACYLSCEIMGVNPFDQPGVEAYKENMFRLLRT